ncbi:glycosyltransferase [Pseudomonas sp. CLCA07]
MEYCKPVVSVVCVTYNHELYIASAIESFLSQKADFEYEIVVHDDSSTDKTGEVVCALCLKYPGRIKYIRQPKNMYSQGVKIFDLAFSYASGEFIAVCEGDDFWNDDKKLQKQFDYMRENPKCGAVFSDTDILIQETGRTIIAHDASRGFSPPTGDVKKSLLRGNPYKTCTVMLKAEAVFGYAKHAKITNAKMEDYVAWLYVAGRYDFGYIPEVLATYRILPVSASHFSTDAGRVGFDRNTYKVAVYFNNFYGEIIDGALIKVGYSYSLFCFFLRAGKPIIAFRYFNCSFEFFKLLFSGGRRSIMNVRKLVAFWKR